ncbi:MAG: hypothetical protein AAEI08_04885 [Gammaproteobacteria bacterium]
MSRRLKIFISSPGDVIPERQIARKVIGELNEEMMGKVFLVPVLWEQEPLLASGTFQTQIDAPEETEILLGILWSRIGSPLPESILRPDGTRYDSGTAFEFESALAEHQKKGKPDILLYRKLGAPSVSLDNRKEFMERLEQMDALDAYIKKQLMAEDGSYIAAFHTFESEEQFETILKTHLRKLILKQLEESEEKESGEKQSTEENTKGPPAVPDTLSVAVLPFDNMSKDPEQAFFVDGLTEDIITSLSRFKDLDVIARNSTFQYKGRSVDVRQVGQELGARYVLEGSVRKVGNALRVTGQLLDADDGSHLWAETYDRDLSTTSIFEVQDEISGRVGSIIGDLWGVLGQVRFERLKQEDLGKLDSDQSVAYALAAVQRTGHHLEALEALERATVRDPHNGNVWALLAHAYADEHTSGQNTSTEPLDRAFDAARKAVELEPMSDRTRSALARVHFCKGDTSGALAEAEQALKISPNSSTRLCQHAYYLTLSGDWDHGMKELEKALEINEFLPSNLWCPLFLDHYRNERYEDAIKSLHKFHVPRLWITHACLAAVHGQLKNTEKASAAISQLLTLRPEFHKDAKGYLQRCQGSPEGIDKLLDGLRKAGLDIPNGPVPRGLGS